MAKKCTSCGKEVKIRFAEFTCPACGKGKIHRCESCRDLAVTYECVCGFEGP